MKVYVGVGHGRKPNGVYDPGAVAPDGTQEHRLAHRVVEHLSAGLTRSGVNHHAERDSGVGHDPNGVGATHAVNAGGYGLAVEVHFDSAAAPSGGFGIYASEGSRAKLLATHVRREWQNRGMPLRSNYADRRGLYFLQRTACPALIWECDNVGPQSEETLKRMGEALAHGICSWLGVPYRSHPGTPPTHKEVTVPSVAIEMVDALAAPAGGVPDSTGAWVLARDGGVFAMHGAPFWGSYPALPEGARQGARTFVRVEPRDDGRPGYMLRSNRDELYRFGPDNWPF